ncbi:MAG TPA: hypothetical protein VGH80_14135 [Xanthomonadaceae bacterium]|jgi:hypothetical protein
MERNTLARTALEAVGLSLLLSTALFLVQWRYGFNWSDEGLLWFLSQRVHAGQMPIRDLFGYDPARYLWVSAWFRALGGDGLFELRLADAAFGFLGLAVACATMAAAGIRLSIRIAALVLLAVAMGFPQHKVYEQVWSLFAVASLAWALFRPEAIARWLVLGAATGLAATFGRNLGVYCALAGLFGLAIAPRLHPARAGVRRLGAWAAGMVAGYAPMLAWFTMDERFRAAMIRSVLFTPQWQLPLPIPFPWRTPQGFGSAAAIQATATSWLCVAVIAVYAVSAVGVARALYKPTPEPADGSPSRLLALEAASFGVGVAYLYQAFDRADFPHIAQSILPFFLILAIEWQRTERPAARAACACCAALAMLAWLPSQPRVAASLAAHQAPGSRVRFAIDGRQFVIDAGQARVLESSRREFERCHARDGGAVAMPYYPGILAYLHASSPYWDLYYLYPRSPDFQNAEIAALKTAGTRLAIVNVSDAMDGRNDLRIARTNPLLLDFIHRNFRLASDPEASANGFGFYEFDCGR